MKKKRITFTNGPQPDTVRKCWNIITGAGSDSAEITLYGDVCSQHPTDWWTGEPLPGQYITPEGFLDDLALIKDKSEIVVKINSGGGDLYTGIAIHNALKGLKGHKTVVIEGLAASAASVIACAGDEVQVHAGSIIRIHGAAVGTCDYLTAEDVKKIAKNLEAANNAIAQIYHEKTGLEVDTLRSMMKAETWMVGKDAVDKKFANTLLSSDGPSMSLTADKKVLLIAGVRHDLKAFHNIPGNIPVEQDAPDPQSVANKNKPLVSGEGETTMTEKELRAQFPDIVAAIEAAAVENARTEAVTQERARLQSIEEIESQIGNAELIAEAKYGKGACSAEQLALRAMQAQAKLGTAHLDGLKKDGDASGVKNVAGNPNSGNGDDGSDDAAELQGIMNVYKAHTGGTRR